MNEVPTDAGRDGIQSASRWPDISPMVIGKTTVLLPALRGLLLQFSEWKLRLLETEIFPVTIQFSCLEPDDGSAKG